MVPCLVITHGNLGGELIRLVEMVLGPVTGLASLSNAGKSTAELSAEIKRRIDEATTDSAAGVLVMVDDYGSSCANAVQMASGDTPSVVILSGVNLAMLLGYASWHETLSLQELAQKLLEAGRRAIARVGPTGGD